jgi:uncharacterized protein (DUF1778 family)
MKDAEATDRITNRVSKPVVQKLQEAADLTGSTINQFMVQASLEKAEKILEKEQTIYFSRNDAAMLIELLDNPPAPNPALIKAFERFQQREAENGNQDSPARRQTRRK